MKTIGFIDIHPRSPLGQAHASGPAGIDQSALYLFHEVGGEYVSEERLAFPADPEAYQGIDEFYVSLPASLLDFRVLTFPFADKKKIEEVLPLELSNLIIGEPGETVFDSILLGGGDTAAEVLAVYIRAEALKRILAELAGLGIDPRVITSLDLRPPADHGSEALREEFLASLGSCSENPAVWDPARRTVDAAREIVEPTLNLRRGAFGYTKDAARTGKALRMTAVLAFALVFVLHANFLFQALMAKKESAAIAAQMRFAYAGLFPGEKKTIDELYQLKSHIKESREMGDLLSGVAPLKLLVGLTRGMDANVVYTDISVGKDLIKMKAEARSMDDLARLQKKLSGSLAGVSVSDIKPGAQGKVAFTVIAKGQR